MGFKELGRYHKMSKNGLFITLTARFFYEFFDYTAYTLTCFLSLLWGSN